MKDSLVNEPLCYLIVLSVAGYRRVEDVRTQYLFSSMFTVLGEFLNIYLYERGDIQWKSIYLARLLAV